MAHKNKKSQIDLSNRIQTVSAQLGIVLMAGAATLMTLESLHPIHESHHSGTSHQPAYATVEAHATAGDNEHERSAREETGPHFISYGASQRTAARAGRI